MANKKEPFSFIDYGYCDKNPRILGVVFYTDELTMEREKILKKYSAIVGKDSAKARELIKQLNYKDDHYLLTCIAQTYLDESRFETDSTMRTYLDRRKWRIAERYIIKAFNINPDCADVLYTMGEIRNAYVQTDIAIYCFERINKLGVKRIVSGKCQIDAVAARELVNDSKFELYRLYHDSNPDLSRRYLSLYKAGLEKGIKTIFKPLKKYLLD